MKLKLIRCLLSLNFACLLVFSAVAQTDQPTPEATTDETPLATQEPEVPSDFREILKLIRSNESEINRLYTTMPIGFPDRKKAFRDRIDALKAHNAVLRENVQRVAIESFQRAPNENADAARVIYRKLLTAIDPRSADDRFRPQEALDLANLLINQEVSPERWPVDVNFPNVIYQAFRASFALEQFDVAASMLDRIESLGIKLQPYARERLEYVRKNYEQELLTRRQEANIDDLPRVKLETTEGDIIVELFENHAPQTVANFINLVERNFYDNLKFFVVQPGSYARTGSPDNQGTSDAGYQISNELDREKLRYHFAGSLSMVTQGENKIAGSQFLITAQPYPEFDGEHTVFGRVIEGLDVVRQLQTIDLNRGGNPERASAIIKATVIRKRDHEYQPSRLAADSAPKTGGQ